MEGVGIREWRGFYMVMGNNMNNQEEQYIRQEMQERYRYYEEMERQQIIEDTIAYMKKELEAFTKKTIV